MIRFAEKQDIKKIMQFINSYWKEGHILAVNEEFFQYQHLIGEKVSYVISENEDGEIDAILGYIPYGRKYRDIMTALWKAIPTATPSLGLELLDFLRINGNVRLLASPGVNPKTGVLYQYLGYRFGKMAHWYRLNRNCHDFRIAKITNKTIPAVKKCALYSVYENWEQFKIKFDFLHYQNINPVPYKEEWYLEKRYFCHPVWNYIVIGIKDDLPKERLAMIFRLDTVKGHKALRLVDCIGEYRLLSCSASIIDELLVRYDAEYADCYETGLPDKFMAEGGWLKTEETGNIIPNYFQPFEQKNIDIYYFSTDENIVLFKGDGDQDRPS